MKNIPSTLNFHGGGTVGKMAGILNHSMHIAQLRSSLRRPGNLLLSAAVLLASYSLILSRGLWFGSVGGVEGKNNEK